MAVLGSIPPMTADQMRDALKEDDSRTTYAYVGAAGDRGWELALGVANSLPRLDLFRADSPAGLWFAVEPRGGAVFGFDDESHTILSPAEAADFGAVLRANSQSPGGGT